MLMESENIPAQRVDREVVFPAARSAEVAELVTSVLGGGGVVDGGDEGPVAPTPPAAVFGTRVADAQVVAGGVRRLGGWLIDSVLALLLFELIRGVLGSNAVASWMAFCVVAVYQVVAIRSFGQTAGKAFVGTQVVDLRSGALPRWTSALTRWAIPAAPILFDFAPTAALPLAPLAQVVIFAGVLLPPHRRGLHDLGAGTVVVLARG
jgi:uncharacterized RDD family membrane protein YckC